MSQLTKTIKMALKSTEEERAILRARSAVQRFPVVEWRQRTEDFHKRSITISRALAGPNAWRESDCDGGAPRVIADTDDWQPENQAYPQQPEWDRNSVMSGMESPRSPYGSMTPTMPPPSPGGNGDYLSAAPRYGGQNRSSYQSASEESGDYFSNSQHSRASTAVESPGGYGNFLEKANRVIGRDQRHAPDPFLDGALTAPQRPFGGHSRVSSVESISSIVDEKANSPLNKAIASVSLSCIDAQPDADILLSSLTPTVGSLPSSSRSCRILTRRIRNTSSVLRSS